MRYKRKEAFRFSFNPPLPATIKIIGSEISNRQSIYKGELIDLSPHGLGLKIAMDLMGNEKQLKLEASFTIYLTEIRVIGEVMWKKSLGNYFVYGIRSREDTETEQQIVQDLKFYAKKLHLEAKKPK